MSVKSLIGLSFLVWLVNAGLSFAVAPGEVMPPEEAFKLSVWANPKGEVVLDWTLAPHHYLYRKKFKFVSKTEGVSLGEPRFPAGEVKHDEHFGEMEIYHDRLEIFVPVMRNPASINAAELEITAQGCNDEAGICYPPFKQKVLLSLPPVEKPEVGSNPIPQTNPLGRLSQTFKNLAQGDLLPPEQAFRFSAQVKDSQTLQAEWQIAEGYYLYRDKFQFSLLDSSGIELGPIEIPSGETKQEEEGPRQVFHEIVSLNLPLKRTQTSATTLRLKAKFQGCAEKGVCYPPMEEVVSLDIPAVGAAPTQTAPVEAATVAEQDRIADSLKADSLWLTVASFFGFGLLMAFSPCIFPMIPILSGIIVGHGEKISTLRALSLSLSYVLAAALAYTFFGVLAGLFGSNLQATFQNPWVIGAFSALFVVLSLSMFGFFELQMPNFIQSRVSEISHHQKGGTLTGAAIMGALSALIVGPCMAAPLAGALIYIGQTGDAWLGGLALFALGLGMGVPLLVVGMSAGTLLPKAGMWMNAVKSIFGVGMLAVAVWLLDRILPPRLTMSLWALLLIVPAIYLSALENLPVEASGWRKLWKGLGVAMLGYGLMMLVGVAQGNSDPLQPLRISSFSGPATGTETAESHLFEKVASVAELEAQLAKAKAEGRRVMLDYYADWCVSCKEMEKTTFADPAVRAALKKAVLLQADVTANTDQDAALLKRYGLYGPPATLFFTPDGTEKKTHRLVGYIKPADFLAHLQKVWD